MTERRPKKEKRRKQTAPRSPELLQDVRNTGEEDLLLMLKKIAPKYGIYKSASVSFGFTEGSGSGEITIRLTKNEVRKNVARDEKKATEESLRSAALEISNDLAWQLKKTNNKNPHIFGKRINVLIDSSSTKFIDEDGVMKLEADLEKAYPVGTYEGRNLKNKSDRQSELSEYIKTVPLIRDVIKNLNRMRSQGVNEDLLPRETISKDGGKSEIPRQDVANLATLIAHRLSDKLMSLQVDTSRVGSFSDIPSSTEARDVREIQKKIDNNILYIERIESDISDIENIIDNHGGRLAVLEKQLSDSDKALEENSNSAQKAASAILKKRIREEKTRIEKEEKNKTSKKSEILKLHAFGELLERQRVSLQTYFSVRDMTRLLAPRELRIKGVRGYNLADISLEKWKILVSDQVDIFGPEADELIKERILAKEGAKDERSGEALGESNWEEYFSWGIRELEVKHLLIRPGTNPEDISDDAIAPANYKMTEEETLAMIEENRAKIVDLQDRRDRERDSLSKEEKSEISGKIKYLAELIGLNEGYLDAFRKEKEEYLRRERLIILDIKNESINSDHIEKAIIDAVTEYIDHGYGHKPFDFAGANFIKTLLEDGHLNIDLPNNSRDLSVELLFVQADYEEKNSEKLQIDSQKEFESKKTEAISGFINRAAILKDAVYSFTEKHSLFKDHVGEDFDLKDRSGVEAMVLLKTEMDVLLEAINSTLNSVVENLYLGREEKDKSMSELEAIKKLFLEDHDSYQEMSMLYEKMGVNEDTVMRRVMLDRARSFSDAIKNGSEADKKTAADRLYSFLEKNAGLSEQQIMHLRTIDSWAESVNALDGNSDTLKHLEEMTISLLGGTGINPLSKNENGLSKEAKIKVKEAFALLEESPQKAAAILEDVFGEAAVPYLNTGFFDGPIVNSMGLRKPLNALSKIPFRPVITYGTAYLSSVVLAQFLFEQFEKRGVDVEQNLTNVPYLLALLGMGVFIKYDSKFKGQWLSVAREIVADIENADWAKFAKSTTLVSTTSAAAIAAFTNTGITIESNIYSAKSVGEEMLGQISEFKDDFSGKIRNIESVIEDQGPAFEIIAEGIRLNEMEGGELSSEQWEKLRQYGYTEVSQDNFGTKPESLGQGPMTLIKNFYVTGEWIDLDPKIESRMKSRPGRWEEWLSEKKDHESQKIGIMGSSPTPADFIRENLEVQFFQENEALFSRLDELQARLEKEAVTFVEDGSDKLKVIRKVASGAPAPSLGMSISVVGEMLEVESELAAAYILKQEKVNNTLAKLEERLQIIDQNIQLPSINESFSVKNLIDQMLVSLESAGNDPELEGLSQWDRKLVLAGRLLGIDREKVFESNLAAGVTLQLFFDVFIAFLMIRWALGRRRRRGEDVIIDEKKILHTLAKKTLKEQEGVYKALGVPAPKVYDVTAAFYEMFHERQSSVSQKALRDLTLYPDAFQGALDLTEIRKQWEENGMGLVNKLGLGEITSETNQENYLKRLIQVRKSRLAQLDILAERIYLENDALGSIEKSEVVKGKVLKNKIKKDNVFDIDDIPHFTYSDDQIKAFRASRKIRFAREEVREDLKNLEAKLVEKSIASRNRLLESGKKDRSFSVDLRSPELESSLGMGQALVYDVLEEASKNTSESLKRMFQEQHRSVIEKVKTMRDSFKNEHPDEFDIEIKYTQYDRETGSPTFSFTVKDKQAEEGSNNILLSDKFSENFLGTDTSLTKSSKTVEKWFGSRYDLLSKHAESIRAINRLAGSINADYPDLKAAPTYKLSEGKQKLKGIEMRFVVSDELDNSEIVVLDRGLQLPSSSRQGFSQWIERQKEAIQVYVACKTTFSEFILSLEMEYPSVTIRGDLKVAGTESTKKINYSIIAENEKLNYISMLAPTEMYGGGEKDKRGLLQDQLEGNALAVVDIASGITAAAESFKANNKDLNVEISPSFDQVQLAGKVEVAAVVREKKSGKIIMNLEFEEALSSRPEKEKIKGDFDSWLKELDVAGDKYKECQEFFEDAVSGVLLGKSTNHALAEIRTNMEISTKGSELIMRFVLKNKKGKESIVSSPIRRALVNSGSIDKQSFLRWVNEEVKKSAEVEQIIEDSLSAIQLSGYEMTTELDYSYREGNSGGGVSFSVSSQQGVIYKNSMPLNIEKPTETAAKLKKETQEKIKNYESINSTINKFRNEIESKGYTVKGLTPENTNYFSEQGLVLNFDVVSDQGEKIYSSGKNFDLREESNASDRLQEWLDFESVSSDRQIALDANRRGLPEKAIRMPKETKVFLESEDMAKKVELYMYLSSEVDFKKEREIIARRKKNASPEEIRAATTAAEDSKKQRTVMRATILNALLYLSGKGNIPQETTIDMKKGELRVPRKGLGLGSIYKISFTDIVERAATENGADSILGELEEVNRGMRIAA